MKSIRTVISVCVFLYSNITNSQPALSLALSSGAGVEQGASVTITGSGFGSKTQAPPILYDLSSKVHQNGVENNSQSSLSHGTSISSGEIWSKPSSSAWPTKISANIDTRSENNSHHYHVDGAKGWVGWPVSYGGQNTPADNQQLYLSWWYMPLVNPSNYWTWELSDQTGGFIGRTGGKSYGETLSFSGDGITGQVITDDDGTLHFSANGATSSKLDGLTITGLQSGSTARLDKTLKYATPGSNKFVRIWEEPTGKAGFRFSWTQMHRTAASTVGGDKIEWSRTTLNVGAWNHMEMMLDLDENKIKAWVNSVPMADFDISGTRRLNGQYSPTIALLGYDGKQSYQSSRFGEIYMDNTQQRVLVSSSSTWAQLTHSEIQYPIAWDDTNITFEMNLGSLDRSNSLYAYVVNQYGEVNAKGLQLNIEFSPPKAPASLNALRN